MEYYAFEEIDEETDRFGVTAKVYELRGLKRSEGETLTQNQHVCDLAEALAAGDMTTAAAIWARIENN